MSRKNKNKGKTKVKGSAKGSAKTTPHRTPSKRHPSQSWLGQEAAPKNSLADEARWASSHRTTAFDSSKKLRQMPIQFVSAGHLEGTIKDDLLPVQPAELDLNSESESESKSEPESESNSALAPATHDTTEAMAKMVIRSPSPAISDASSSSDEVVFRGRGVHVPPPVQTTPLATKAVESLAAAHVDSDVDSGIEDFFAHRRRGKPAWEGTTTPWQHKSKPNIGWLPVADRPDMDAFLRGDVNPHDAAIDDYMQNVKEFGLADDMVGASGFARREMDLDAGSHNDWESVSGSQKEEEQQEGEEAIVTRDNGNWDSDMLQDFDGMSTSSDVMDTIERILSKRTRKSGLHYLCVYTGSVMDDARWLPASFLRSSAEKTLIRSFEEAASLRELVSSSSEATDDEDTEDDEESEYDDDDEELDDETIARVLQKQEELGLGSDELFLYGGDEFFRGPTSGKVSFGGYGKSNKKREARVRGNRDETFPSASAMADALAMDPYGGFDIMDTDRPSLKPKKKGRRGQMPPELEDSDLNEQLQSTWEADRMKKRLKKAEREELRKQGLLGRKDKAADLKIKYKDGISMEDVVEEFREYMLDGRQTINLPPMDAYRRATIHQAANFFGLNSRSRGEGNDRFTILSKTSRTKTYTGDEFDQAVLRKGFLKRLHGPLRGGKGKGPAGGSAFRSGPRVRPQVGYRDGDQVGANAPELGPDNKGHALMLKMGWSKGMALGTVDNQGILHPIAHTVKTNKAGLQ
ncbi:hypothetical protein GQ44DRAFT_612474 [Phaeosphaeriaceae sp. PMI808]|nr:hypothetical protein GQ44DRAFT_612474 [Phaeosphaeriaceae sp. PMI808]